MLRRPLTFEVLLVMCATASGCGGAESSDLFLVGGAGGADGSTAGNLPGSQGGTASNDSAVPSGRDVGLDAPGRGEDASVVTAPDVGPVSTGEVRCGSQVCDLPSSICCKRRKGGGYEEKCRAVADCSGEESSVFACDDAADCASSGGSCCYRYDGYTLVGAFCSAYDACVAGDGMTPTCDSDAPKCPDGYECRRVSGPSSASACIPD